MKPLLPLIGLSSVLATLACGDADQCIQIDRPPVTDPDTPLILGVTFGELMTVVVGERSGPLRWESSEAYVRGLPPPGETRITVTVHEPSMVEEIDLQRQGRSRRPWRNERIDCSGWVDADLQIDLRTDDGALDTTIVAGATFVDPGSASMVGYLTEEDLDALGLDTVDPNATLYVQLSYESDRPAEGALMLRSGSSDGDGDGGGMTVALATWSLE